MWYEKVDNIQFLHRLYNDIPNLKGIILHDLCVYEQGDKVTILFELPRLPDKMPIKWEKNKYNTIICKIDFYNVLKFSVFINNKLRISNIDLEKDVEKIIIKIDGSINALIEAKYAMIQKIDGYKKSL